MTVIDVLLRAEWVERVGYRYDVLLGGEVIVRRSRDPEYDAARVLKDRGIAGRFRTVDFRTGQSRMIVDIAKAARLCTVERADRGPPTIGRYRPFPDLSLPIPRQPSHQGRPVESGWAPTRGDRFKAAGGQTDDGQPPSQAADVRIHEDA